ncbi:MAG: hypothetical protein U7127_14155 [Phormidium sp.]
MNIVAKTITSVAIATTATFSLSVQAEAAQLSIGLNFTGSSSFNSGFIPPDTMGAVGPNHIVEMINGRYAIYSKTNGSLIQGTSLDQFWLNAGIAPRSYSFDPRIVYDPFSQRWFAASVDNARSNNNFLVAVSQSSDPTAGWTGFAIDSDSTNSRWADFPTLGFDRDGVYLAANMFGIAGADLRTAVVTLPKNDLLAVTPTIANAKKFENLSLNSTGFTLQPVVDLDNTGTPAALLSAFNTPNGLFKRSNIVGNIFSPTLDTLGGFISVTPYSSPPSAEQPGPKQNLEAGDNRFSGNIILQNGAFWGVQTVNRGGRAALRWFQIDANTNSLLQEGLIADSNLDFYYGSLAVNDFGDVVIGFSGSGESQFASSYAVRGQTVSNVTTFDTPQLLKAGVASYLRTDGIGRNRWGDYSATVLDPIDPFTFWTFQEWVSAEDIWSIQVTQLKIGATSVPEPTSVLSLLAFGAICTTSVVKRFGGKNKVRSLN